MPQNQGSRVSPSHREPAFGRSQEGRRKREQLYLPWTWVHLGTKSLSPGHSSPLPESKLGQGRLRVILNPNNLPDHCLLLPCPPEQAGTPILAFQPPATRHQPAGSLCSIPACRQWEDLDIGQTGHWDSREGTLEHKQEREMEDRPQKPPGWEKIWN